MDRRTESLVMLLLLSFSGTTTGGSETTSQRNQGRKIVRGACHRRLSQVLLEVAKIKAVEAQVGCVKVRIASRAQSWTEQVSCRRPSALVDWLPARRVWETLRWSLMVEEGFAICWGTDEM